MQVPHPGLGHSGKEVLTEQQSDLSHFGRHQGHYQQGEQDGSQRKDGVIEQQLGFGEALLLKQGHGVGEVSLAIFSPVYAHEIFYDLKMSERQIVKM